MTEGQVFRLTDTTKGVLDGLEQTVTFTYCNDRADADTNLKEVLSRYKAASSKVQVDYMDLDANPALAFRLGLSNGVTYMSSGPPPPETAVRDILSPD